MFINSCDFYTLPQVELLERLFEVTPGKFEKQRGALPELLNNLRVLVHQLQRFKAAAALAGLIPTEYRNPGAVYFR
jgi:hypothetical protein